MSDVFISYARSSEEQAKQVEQALRDAGYAVWRDSELPAHRTYAEVIEERLKLAKAVVALWSVDAAKSQWVRAEADTARELGTLVQGSVDGTMPPIPFNQIQCADLQGWYGEAGHPGWSKLNASIAALAGRLAEAEQSLKPRERSICVLPFANMSGDAEQEYFSDGISEDITTDLSKVSALAVTARNTSFTFKGSAVDVPTIARKLGVSHVLEGSVRKAGNRVRITAQLVDGATGDHVWADRFDRDLTDIFAIQDEISKSIVAALQVKLAPSEDKALQSRGTSNVEAYNLYLMARQFWVAGTFGDIRCDEAIVRICEQAVLLDPGYAEAWALMALAQSELHFWHGKDVNALPAAERALSINTDLSEARCVKAHYLEEQGRHEEANREIEAALRLHPESWEVNREAARSLFRQGRIAESVPYLERATRLMEADHRSPALLITCHNSLGDHEALHRVARVTLERCEAALARNPTDGMAFGDGAAALAILGEEAGAKEWIQRGLLLDPDNLSMQLNMACVFIVQLKEHEAAIELLKPAFEKLTGLAHVKHLEADPDYNAIRGDPRFQQMLAGAKRRLGISVA